MLKSKTFFIHIVDSVPDTISLLSVDMTITGQLHFLVFYCINRARSLGLADKKLQDDRNASARKRLFS
jgi:hypothetical protein